MVGESDKSKRNFIKYLTGAVAGIGATVAAIPFIKFLSPNKYSSTEIVKDIDITKLDSGQVISVNWRSKPFFILKRSTEVISSLNQENTRLRDANSLESSQPDLAHNNLRSIRPDILVVESICTHLGCAVAYNPPGKYKNRFEHGGFYCPCHGSEYDSAGRVVKSVPEPKNLVVPDYEFIDENTLRLKDT